MNAHTTWRVHQARLIDVLATAAAAVIPWSTSATAIVVVLWLLAVLPTMDRAALWRELSHPAGGLPVVFVVLGLIGTLWADVPWAARFGGVDSFVKFLFIPLLFAHFRRSERGIWVLVAFLASCSVILLVSTAIVLWPQLGAGWASPYAPGIPVRDYIAQSGEFVICAFGLVPLALSALRARRWPQGLASLLLAGAFLANVAYVATGRTTLFTIVVLLAILCWREFSWKGSLGVAAAALVVGACVWMSSGYLRARVDGAVREVETYWTDNATTSAGLRLEFWKKSVAFVAEAPLIGHGTGSIRELFRRSAEGESGIAGFGSANPHSQTFAVAIQLGLLGTEVMFAMWMAHLWLFRGGGFASWIGLVVVVQNVVGSVFNSHLFDFTQGWIYVFGVGVAGGMALKERRANPHPQAPPAGLAVPA